MANSRLPSSRLVRRRVDAALNAGLAGNERKAVERWLEPLPSLPAELVGLEIRVREPLPEANQRLLDSLGVDVVLDAAAPPAHSFGDVDNEIRLRRDYQGRR